MEQSDKRRAAAQLPPGDEKALRELERILAETGKLAVAFSGGADSSLLLAVAAKTLGKNALALTAISPTYPPEELAAARAFARERGIKHEIFESNELELPGFADNPQDRCYHCKRELFAKCREIAVRHRIEVIADATNQDDLDDFRPGMRAGDELGVRRPLLEAGFTKDMIRRVSRAMGLATWDKPAAACLASRFPYGVRISEDRLERVAKAERAIRELGFSQVRVRYHDQVARIELEENEITRLLEPELRKQVHERVKAAGFTYVSLDLKGYRTGSMNEA